MKNFYLVSGILFTCLIAAFASETPLSDFTSSNVSEVVTEEFIPNPILSLCPVPLSREITIDGVIEKTWQKSTRFENFTEYEPTENRQPIVKTEGYITFDSKNLYIAFVCHDPDISQLRASLTDRDNIFQDDWVCVSIDPNKDYQKAYQLFANARGVQGDRLWKANGTEDDSYDMVWYSESKIYDDHWTMEMKIPFESLRFPNREKQNWSMHFTRNYPRENEYKFSWMPISQNNNSLMEQAGNLEFHLLRENSEKRRFEILPYTIATQLNYRDENPGSTSFGIWKHNRPESRVGIGVKYGISSSITTDFTYNPDFSQIESDAGQISINYPFALFYEEKRPFFQEGSDIYAVDRFTQGIVLDQYVNLFYSRSINNPLFAAKLSGKVGKISIGYTSALDQNTPYLIPFEENSTVFPTDRKSYNNILRARYDLGNQSSIGFFTSDRRLETTGSNSVAAVDASIRLSEKYTFSTIASLTYTKEPDDSELSQMTGTNVFKIGSESKTAAFDGESFYGHLLRAKFQRASRHLSAAFAYQDFSPGFRAYNGFITSNSYRLVEAVTNYAFRYENNKLFTSIEPRVNVWRKYNYDNILKDTGIVPSILFRFRKQTILQVNGFLFNRENLRGKQFGDARQMWIYFENNTFNSISGSCYILFGKEINRMGVESDPQNPFEIVPSFRFNFNITTKPNSHLTDIIEYRQFNLWTDHKNDKIMGQKIIRNSFMYQFNKNFFIRLIGEYNIINYYNSYISATVNQKYFTVDPLISYKLNAFSVFFIGAHFGAKNNFYLDWNDIKLNDQSVYVKFQYLFRW